MPYFDEPEPPSVEPMVADEWVPEMDHAGWRERHRDLTHDAWVKRGGLTPDALSSLRGLEPTEKARYLEALGADIGSVQRDGFLYANFLEQLKQAAPRSADDPDADLAADAVVVRMQAMGLASAKWNKSSGGPPEPASPRRWWDVTDWLWRLLDKVGRFLVDSIQAFMALARDLIIDAESHQPALAFGASIPPSLEFEIGLTYFKDDNKWSIMKRFIDAILDEMGKLVRP